MQAYLYNYYKKKTRFILAIFKKQESGLEMEDIHKLRVEIKRVRAAFHLLEIIAPKDFETGKNDVFDDVFKNAGRIRELQINRNILNQYNIVPSIASAYIRYASQEEKRLTGEFKKVITGFDQNQLKKTNKKIKQLCIETSKKIILKKSNKFITWKAQKIKKLNTFIDHPYNKHKLRKHLKSLDAIVDLLIQMKKDKKLKKLLTSVKKAGLVLGNWHDNEVLINSLENFIEKNKKTEKNFSSLKKLINSLKIENQQLLKKSYPKINSVLVKIPAKA